MLNNFLAGRGCVGQTIWLWHGKCANKGCADESQGSNCYQLNRGPSPVSSFERRSNRELRPIFSLSHYDLMN